VTQSVRNDLCTVWLHHVSWMYLHQLFLLDQAISSLPWTLQWVQLLPCVRLYSLPDNQSQKQSLQKPRRCWSLIKAFLFVHNLHSHFRVQLVLFKWVYKKQNKWSVPGQWFLILIFGIVYFTLNGTIIYEWTSWCIKDKFKWANETINSYLQCLLR